LRLRKKLLIFNVKNKR